MTDLTEMKAQRDALSEHIKLIETGIRKGVEEACYSQQLITVNEARIVRGQRQITPNEFASGILVDEANERAAIVAWLRNGSIWLNGGECCGQKCSDGVCAAPACLWGDELKMLHSAADAIEAGEHIAAIREGGKA